MDLFAFIQVMDPTKVKVGERKCAEEEARLWTVGRVVSLLPIVPACSESELETSVERLFDEAGSADHEDSAASGGREAKTGIATGVRIVAEENVVAETFKRPRKKRQAVTDASGSSHPPKRLRGDHKASSEVAIGVKSSSALKELLASTMLNIKVGVAVVATLPMVTSSVSATLKHESDVPADSITGLNMRTIGASERFVISSDSSHNSSTNASGTKGDSIIRSAVVPSVMTEAVVTSYAVNIPPVREMEFNVGTAHQACLNEEVRMQTDYCLSEKKRLESECEKQAGLLKAKDDEVSVAEATKTMRATEIDALKQRNVSFENEKESLDEKVAELQSFVSARDLELKDLNVAIKEFQIVQMNILNDKVAQLDADLLEMALYLEEKFYPHLLTTISGRRWLSTHGLKLVVVKCLNSQEYLSALGATISRAIEKGMQNGLSASIDHGKADQVVLGETSLSFALSVTHSRVERIMENVVAKRSAFIGVWTPLVNPLSVENLMGEAGTSDGVTATTATTTALSTTFDSTSSVPPIIIEDYEIVVTDGLKDS
nr:hypothetical protein [Tanacetum cinerariifolium]